MENETKIKEYMKKDSSSSIVRN